MDLIEQSTQFVQVVCKYFTLGDNGHFGRCCKSRLRASDNGFRSSPRDYQQRLVLLCGFRVVSHKLVLWLICFYSLYYWVGETHLLQIDFRLNDKKVPTNIVEGEVIRSEC